MHFRPSRRFCCFAVFFSGLHAAYYSCILQLHTTPACCILHAAYCRLYAADCMLHIACCILHAVRIMHYAACCINACCVLHAAYCTCMLHTASGCCMLRLHAAYCTCFPRFFHQLSETIGRCHRYYGFRKLMEESREGKGPTCIFITC